MMALETMSTERRQEARTAVHDEWVDLLWTDMRGIELEKRIACVDFSKGGARLQCEDALPVNTDVKLTFRTAPPKYQHFYAQVIRCQANEQGYMIAVRNK